MGLQVVEVDFRRFDSVINREGAMPVVERVFASLCTIQIVSCPSSEVAMQASLAMMPEIVESNIVWLVTFTLIPSSNGLVIATTSNAVFIDDVPTLAILAAHVDALDIDVPTTLAVAVVAVVGVAHIFWLTFPMEVSLWSVAKQIFY